MKKTLKDFNFDKKVVILRCDFNVSYQKGKIIDDTKLVESIPTIKYLFEHNAKVIILSHFGKVKEEKDKKNNSLLLVSKRLAKLLPKKIKFVPYTNNPIIKEEIDKLDYGKAILLENTRFEDLEDKKESNCNMSLAKYWASLGDIFINDAFGVMHRKHASNVGITNYLDSGIGLLVEKEIKELDKLDNPKRPFEIIMGGVKVSDKIKIIESLISKVDYLYIGGAMAFTFLKAIGMNVGSSFVETDMIETCNILMNKYPNKIVLPVDFYGSDKINSKKEKELYFLTDIPDNFIGMDIGRQTIDMFTNQIEGTKTIFWNGPLGIYEDHQYQCGTEEVLKYIAIHVDNTILGGGDIVGCAAKLGYKDKITFCSTGGGATLEYLASKDLPGLVNISERKEK